MDEVEDALPQTMSAMVVGGRDGVWLNLASVADMPSSIEPRVDSDRRQMNRETLSKRALGEYYSNYNI